MRPDADSRPLLSGRGWKETGKAALGRHLLARVPLGSPEGCVFPELALKTNREFLGTGNGGSRGRPSSDTTGSARLSPLNRAPFHVRPCCPPVWLHSQALGCCADSRQKL